VTYQIEDPAVIAAYTVNPLSAPVAFITQKQTASHFDPQLSATYRVNRNFVARASGGSGITVPYASLISGLPGVDLPNGANNLTYTLSPKNPQLQPETTVAYDGGLDYRMGDGGILSFDYFNNTIHNVWVTTTIPNTPTTPVPGCPTTANACQTALTINGPI